MKKKHFLNIVLLDLPWRHCCGRYWSTGYWTRSAPGGGSPPPLRWGASRWWRRWSLPVKHSRVRCKRANERAGQGQEDNTSRKTETESGSTTRNRNGQAERRRRKHALTLEGKETEIPPTLKARWLMTSWEDPSRWVGPTETRNRSGLLDFARAFFEKSVAKRVKIKRHFEDSNSEKPQKIQEKWD